MRASTVISICPVATSALGLFRSQVETRSDATSRCTAATFQPPEAPGIQVLGIVAAPLYNFTVGDAVSKPVNVEPLCNVTVTYTHPGYNDTINVYNWLPLENWNGRFAGIGGGGWAGTFPAIGAWKFFESKYACAGTDTGHVTNAVGLDWSQTSPFNVNYNLLQDFAFKALDELPKIAKQVIKDYYGEPPSYSYWQGCSGGGRQGMMSAQRFPENYDGILANAPAINWSSFVPGIIWPAVVMDQMNHYPTSCELNAFSKGVVSACDGLDGVMDGVITYPHLCRFDPQSLIDTRIQCPDNSSITVSAETANVVAKIWEGPTNVDGNFIWYGLDPGASLLRTAATVDNGNGSRKAVPEALGSGWFQYFLTKNTSFDITTATSDTAAYADLSLQGIREYSSILDTNSPDLRHFRDAGGKMITWFGTFDNIIPPKGMVPYYEQVRALQPDVDNFYRVFFAPGCAHCFPNVDGTGYYPDTNAIDALVAWVENGVAPDHLPATDYVTGRHQPLCPYPKLPRWDGVSDSSLLSSYSCQ